MIASVDPPSLCVPPSGTLRRAAPLRHTARDRHAALHGGRRAHGREDASEGSEVQKGLALSPISVFGTDSFMELGSIISPGGSKTLVRSRRRAHALHRLPRTGCPSLEGQDLPDPAWIRLIRSGPSKGGARSILELFVSARTRGGGLHSVPRYLRCGRWRRYDDDRCCWCKMASVRTCPARGV